MKILTDIPTELGWMEEGKGWSSLDQAEKMGKCKPLWDLMGQGKVGWVSEAPHFLRDNFWDALAVVERSNESQFDLLQKGHADLPARTACIALHGRNFHGQRNRPWTAHRGNLHLSTFIRTSVPASHLGLGLTMLPAVATVKAIEKSSTLVPRPGIKWVNDILCDGKKVAGVLTASGVEEDRVCGVFLGVGMNLAVAPQVNPTPFVPSTGCLAEWDERLMEGLGIVLGLILKELSIAYNHLIEFGAEDLLTLYRDYSCVLDRDVRIWNESLSHVEGLPPAFMGRVNSINPDLSLNLEGVPVPVTKGRLAFENNCRH